MEPYKINRTHSNQWWSFQGFMEDPHHKLEYPDRSNCVAACQLYQSLHIQKDGITGIIAMLPFFIVYRKSAAFDAYTKIFCIKVIKDLMITKGINKGSPSWMFMEGLASPLIDQVLACHHNELKIGGCSSDANSRELEENEIPQWIEDEAGKFLNEDFFPEQAVRISKKIMTMLPLVIRRVETVRNWSHQDRRNRICQLVDRLLVNDEIDPEFKNDVILPAVAEIVDLLWKTCNRGVDLERAFIKPEHPTHTAHDLSGYYTDEGEWKFYETKKNWAQKIAGFFRIGRR